jgi:hypothetical protein
MSLSQKRVTVTFTHKQAKALHSAAGEILFHDDAIDAHFDDRSKIAPALAAWDKLLSAYVSVEMRSLPNE